MINSTKFHQGERVCSLRKAKCVSINEIAAILGVSIEDYKSIEKEPIIVEEILDKIAAYLNIGKDWLKEVDLPFGQTVYYQKGNGNNFQNTGDINMVINNTDIDEINKIHQEYSEEKFAMLYKIIDEQSKIIRANKIKNQDLQRIIMEETLRNRNNK